MRDSEREICPLMLMAVIINKGGCNPGTRDEDDKVFCLGLRCQWSKIDGNDLISCAIEDIGKRLC